MHLFPELIRVREKKCGIAPTTSYENHGLTTNTVISYSYNQLKCTSFSHYSNLQVLRAGVLPLVHTCIYVCHAKANLRTTHSDAEQLLGKMCDGGPELLHPDV